MDVQFPVGVNREKVHVGALTAAYLTWFHYFGYSWALQKHLDPVRAQIQNPDQTILHAGYANRYYGKPWDIPWIGFVEIDALLCLAYDALDLFILLPPADQIDFYGSLKIPRKQTKLGRVLKLGFQREGYPPPYVLLYEHRTIICPDTVKDRCIFPEIWQYPGGTQQMIKRAPPPEVGSSPRSTASFLDHLTKEKHDHSEKRVTLNCDLPTSV